MLVFRVKVLSQNIPELSFDFESKRSQFYALL